jgi:hypothetical protein
MALNTKNGVEWKKTVICFGPGQAIPVGTAISKVFDGVAYRGAHNYTRAVFTGFL